MHRHQDHKKLYLYAFSFTRHDELSKDIVQNVLINFWKQRERIDNNLKLKSYLYKAVYNQFIDHYRKNKKKTTLEQLHHRYLQTIVLDMDDTSQERLIAIVKKEIGLLPPKCKQTFLLSKKEGLSNIEIAEYMDVSIKSVEAHITKAFRLLRRRLGDSVELILFIMFDLKK